MNFQLSLFIRLISVYMTWRIDDPITLLEKGFGVMSKKPISLRLPAALLCTNTCLLRSSNHCFVSMNDVCSLHSLKGSVVNTHLGFWFYIIDHGTLIICLVHCNGSSYVLFAFGYAANNY